MSIRGMPSVEDQPTVTLIRWRVLRIKVKKVSIDFVLGWCLEDGHARMSTPIKHHDAVARTLITKSRQVYVLEGAPDYDDDAQYIAEEHFGRAAANAKDVSAEYFNDVIRTAQAICNVALDSVVSLSDAQSSSFISDMDEPFQPNAKLANALKRQRNPKNE